MNLRIICMSLLAVLTGACGAGLDDPTLVSTESAVCGPPADVWKQFIEKQSPPGTVRALAFPAYYYEDQWYCDNDPDIDYVFVYRLNYQCNPDGLKWYSTNGVVNTLFGNLSGGSPTPWDDDVHLCVGKGTADFIGLGTVYNSMYVYYP